MKKFLQVFPLLLIAFIAFNKAGAQVCTPDANQNSPGWYPDPIPTGCVGQPYDTIITFVFPQDTSVSTPLGPITVPFDSFTVNNVTVLPTGLTYTCNVATCVYVPVAGQTLRGCVRITGTPTATYPAAPGDSVTIDASAWVTLLTSPTAFPATIKIGMTILAAGQCGTAVDPNFSYRLALSFFPNPANDLSKVSFNLPYSGMVNVSLVDIYGRQVMDISEGQLNAGYHQVYVNNLGQLPAGVYFLQFNLNNGEFKQTLKVLKN